LAPSAAREKEILEKVKQVELLNESNQTLRSQSEAYAKRAKDLQDLLDKARAELEPVREQVRVLRAEVEAKDAQIGRLETESRTWQERVQQILSKVCGVIHLGNDLLVNR
jgi:nucleoprotein TPR